MPTAKSPASKEVVTAALLVIGGKILSGRTKDQNIGYVAECLTAVGIDLKEVRVVGNEEKAIVDALNALRHRYTYVFTTGGIGPTRGLRGEDVRCADRHRSGARSPSCTNSTRPRCTEARAGQTRGRGDAGASAASTIA